MTRDIPIRAVSGVFVPELMYLVHAMYGYPGIDAMLIFLQKLFLWPTMIRKYENRQRVGAVAPMSHNKMF